MHNRRTFQRGAPARCERVLPRCAPAYGIAKSVSPKAESVLVEEIGSFFARGPSVSVKRGRKSNVQATLDAHERLPRFQRVTCRFVRLVASSVLLIPLLQQGQKRRNKFFFLIYFHLIGHRPCWDYIRLTFLLLIVARGLPNIKLFWDTCLLHILYSLTSIQRSFRSSF